MLFFVIKLCIISETVMYVVLCTLVGKIPTSWRVLLSVPRDCKKMTTAGSSELLSPLVTYRLLGVLLMLKKTFKICCDFCKKLLRCFLHSVDKTKTTLCIMH
jgi:hypothetical protein